MIFEFITTIEWLSWIEKILCAIAIIIVLGIFIWVLPSFLDWIISLVPIHAKIRQGVVLLVRLVMATAGTFIIADVLGFNSDTVITALVAVFGVGISWAIKDNVSNALSGVLLFILQSYGIG